MKKGGTGKLIPTPRQKCPEKNPVLLWLKSLKKYLEKISKSKVETETQTKKNTKYGYCFVENKGW